MELQEGIRSGWDLGLKPGGLKFLELLLCDNYYHWYLSIDLQIHILTQSERKKPAGAFLSLKKIEMLIVSVQYVIKMMVFQAA